MLFAVVAAAILDDGKDEGDNLFSPLSAQKSREPWHREENKYLFIAQ